jgi:hypothetical protein
MAARVAIHTLSQSRWVFQADEAAPEFLPLFQR